MFNSKDNKALDPKLTEGHPVSYRDPEPAGITFARMNSQAAEEYERNHQPKPECYSKNPDDPVYRYGIEEYEQVAGKSFSRVRQEKLDAKIDEEMVYGYGIGPNEPAASFLAKMAESKIAKRKKDVREKLKDIGLTERNTYNLASPTYYL